MVEGADTVLLLTYSYVFNAFHLRTPEERNEDLDFRVRLPNSNLSSARTS